MDELENFSMQVAASSGLVLLDFWADWCMPCKQLIPTLETFASSDVDIKIYKVNIDGPGQDLAIANAVRAVPTLILFKDGELVDRKVGVLSLSQLKEWVANFS